VSIIWVTGVNHSGDRCQSFRWQVSISGVTGVNE